MASTIEDAEAAAERLEAALERIARVSLAPAAGAGADVPVAEISQRLDRMIARLRVALDTPS
jgi:hypothetical protein